MDILTQIGFVDVLSQLLGNFAGTIRKNQADQLFDQGIEQFYRSQFRTAMQSWQEALAIYQKIANRKGEANSLGNLGNAYQSLGQFPRAIEFHEQSLLISREIGYRQGEAASLGNLGNAYYSLGQFPRAINFHEQSLLISREIGYRQGEAASLGSLGNAYQSLGQFPRAIEFHEQLLQISREIGYRQGEASSLGNLGNAYQSLGQFPRAIEFHEQSLLISRGIGYRQGEAAFLDNLGETYQTLAQFPRAIEFHEKSLQISREIGYRLGEAISLNNLGETYYKMDELTKAEKVLDESIKIKESLRVGLQDEHKISILETQKDTYQTLQQVLVKQDKIEDALAISERGRARAFIELLQKSLSDETEPTYISIDEIKHIAQTQNITLVEYSLIDDENIYIWVIQPNGKINHRYANLSPLQPYNRTLAEIITQGRLSIDVMEHGSEGKEIELVKEFKRDHNHNFPLMQLLYQILIAPIAELLPPHPDDQVIIIPHYDLFLVPFNALQDEKGQYFIEKHTIVTAPSIQVMTFTHAHHQRVQGLCQASLVVGDPELHPKFKEEPYALKRLDRAKEAAENIAKILKTTPIVGKDATKALVISQMRSMRIIHFSTHGLFEEPETLDQQEPNRISIIPGAIILAYDDTDDGKLSSQEILTEFWEQKLNAEIVVLAACSTGKGKITGDGVLGLSRCFIQAGTPSLLISLWDMGSVAAGEIMAKFYQNLEKGKNRASALRYAMLETKEKLNCPFDWASFVLIGETANMTLETEKLTLE